MTPLVPPVDIRRCSKRSSAETSGQASRAQRCDAQRSYLISANLIQTWLTQFGRGKLSTEEAEASVIAECEAHLATLGRNIGQLKMELNLVNETPRVLTVNGSKK